MYMCDGLELGLRDADTAVHKPTGFSSGMRYMCICRPKRCGTVHAKRTQSMRCRRQCPVSFMLEAFYADETRS